MRIGDLVEHDQRAVAGVFAQDIAKIGAVERLDLQHQALVRRVGGNQPAQVRIVAVLDVEAACGRS